MTGQRAQQAYSRSARDTAVTCPAQPERPVTLAEIAARVHTINPDTGLSTDFLNQYNELSMLLDLAADDPDLLEELADWEPRTYQDHFAASGFRDWTLVVEAYDLSPPSIRAQFDEAIGVLNSVASTGVSALLRGEASPLGPTVRALAAEVQAAIVHASGLINGSSTLGSQAQVDTLFARAQAELGSATPPPERSAAAGMSAEQGTQTPMPLEDKPESATPADGATDDELLDQDAIDALFD